MLRISVSSSKDRSDRQSRAWFNNRDLQVFPLGPANLPGIRRKQLGDCVVFKHLWHSNKRNKMDCLFLTSLDGHKLERWMIGKWVTRKFEEEVCERTSQKEQKT